jgi:hypothetical protein
VLALITGVPNDTIDLAPLSISPFNRYSRLNNQRQNARSHGFTVSKTDSAVLARELCRRKRFDLAVYGQDTSHELDVAADSTLFGNPHVVLGLIGSNRAGQPLGKRIHFCCSEAIHQRSVQKDLEGCMRRYRIKQAAQFTPRSMH